MIFPIDSVSLTSRDNNQFVAFIILYTNAYIYLYIPCTSVCISNSQRITLTMMQF